MKKRLTCKATPAMLCNCWRMYIVISLFFTLSACIGAQKEDRDFFNGKDLTGWSSPNMQYWSVQDGVVVGHLDKELPKNQFLWSAVPVSDFYLSVDVKITPEDANAGIQFRSSSVDENGQAKGYQADIGSSDDITVWGNLYHEHGRALLGGSRHVGKAVKHNDWNHYEILAVGDKIWIAVNGVIGAAVHDRGGEKKGNISLQIHSGPPQTVRYRINKLIHNPKIELAGMDEEALNAYLKEPLSPVDGQAKINLKDDDIIAFAGGTNVSNMQYNGFLEALVQSCFPKAKLRFRNLAWDGDTVFEQFRDVGFGNWNESIDSLNANIVFVQFGQMESLEGEAALDSFIVAYDSLLEKIDRKGRKIILLSPTPFETTRMEHVISYKLNNPLDNNTLEKYATAIRQLASKRAYLYIDLYNSFKEKTSPPFTYDGIHLTEDAHKLTASIIMDAVGIPKSYANDLDPLRKEIIVKNEIWFNYWRPGNWAFLKGDRTHVEFSRDWRNYEKRIFPEEMKEFQPLLESSEEKIYEVAAELQ